jgi:hypothetical protein
MIPDNDYSRYIPVLYAKTFHWQDPNGRQRVQEDLAVGRITYASMIKALEGVGEMSRLKRAPGKGGVQ